MKKLEWHTKQVLVKDLVKLDINPRKISEEKKKKLIESLEKFNLVEIPAVNTDLTIIGGNQRVTALMLVGRGDELIDVRFPNRKLTTKELKEYAIISNTHAGEFDFDMLMAEFEDIDLDGLGFDLEGYEEFMKENEAACVLPEAKEDDYNIPDTIETDIVIGDLFEIGEHRLLCGDSTDSDAVAKLMGGEKADSLITDPPYGIGYAGSMALGQEKHGWKQYEGGWDEKKPESGVLQYFCQITDNQIIWGGNYFTDDLPPTMGWLIWDKGQRGFSLADGEMAWTSFNNALRIKDYARAKANREERNHPTQKPIEIIAWCFEYADRHSKKEIKLVLDPFLGSGSTMVASHQLKRKCYGMELDPKYCQVIIDRMRKLDPTLIIKKNGEEYNAEK